MGRWPRNVTASWLPAHLNFWPLQGRKQDHGDTELGLRFPDRMKSIPTQSRRPTTSPQSRFPFLSTLPPTASPAAPPTPAPQLLTPPPLLLNRNRSVALPPDPLPG